MAPEATNTDPRPPSLREIVPTAQDSPLRRRRWFNASDMDLFVWHDAGGSLVRMQLCFSRGAQTHALTWDQHGVYQFDRIDEGESRPARHKMSPLLIANGELDQSWLAGAFETRAGSLDPDLRRAVGEIIMASPGQSQPASS